MVRGYPVSLLKDGFLLMLLGMGTVFLFLAIMVIWTSLAAKLLAPFAHLLPGDSPKEATPRPIGTEIEDDTLVAVIAAAIQRYRSERRPPQA